MDLTLTKVEASLLLEALDEYLDAAWDRLEESQAAGTASLAEQTRLAILDDVSDYILARMGDG